MQQESSRVRAGGNMTYISGGMWRCTWESDRPRPTHPSAFCNAQPHPHCHLCFSTDYEAEQFGDYSPLEEPPAKPRLEDPSTPPSHEMYAHPPGQKLNFHQRLLSTEGAPGQEKTP